VVSQGLSSVCLVTLVIGRASKFFNPAPLPVSLVLAELPFWPFAWCGNSTSDIFKEATAWVHVK